MKFTKGITINLGNYQNVKLEVAECDSFEQADIALKTEIARLSIVSFHVGVK